MVIDWGVIPPGADDGLALALGLVDALGLTEDEGEVLGD